MFDENSGLVVIWVKHVRLGEVTLEQVPNYLKEIVTTVMNSDA